MLDRNGLQSNILQYTIDLGMYVQTLFFCNWSASPCLVHGCAYRVAELAGVLDYSAAKLAAGSSSCSGAKFQKFCFQKGVYW